MKNLDSFNLLLFDFDGLLVNTEHLHYEAYRQMFANRGHEMQWSFPRYCMAAHYVSTGLREAAYDTIPGLHDQEPDWLVLYEEKKNIYKSLVQEGRVALMPGIKGLLQKIKKSSVKSCVVTNSPADAVAKVREQIPELNIITTWITREQYDRQKPAPDGYIAAIERLAEPSDAIIGFEDTIRGTRSLLDAYRATGKGRKKEAVLVTQLELIGFAELKNDSPYPVSLYPEFDL